MRAANLVRHTDPPRCVSHGPIEPKLLPFTDELRDLALRVFRRAVDALDITADLVQAVDWRSRARLRWSGVSVLQDRRLPRIPRPLKLSLKARDRRSTKEKRPDSHRAFSPRYCGFCGVRAVAERMSTKQSLSSESGAYGDVSTMAHGSRPSGMRPACALGWT